MSYLIGRKDLQIVYITSYEAITLLFVAPVRDNAPRRVQLLLAIQFCPARCPRLQNLFIPVHTIGVPNELLFSLRVGVTSTRPRIGCCTLVF